MDESETLREGEIRSSLSTFDFKEGNLQDSGMQVLVRNGDLLDRLHGIGSKI